MFSPLPKSWRDAYRLIETGKYTGILQSLNSLVNREISGKYLLIVLAFTALATYVIFRFGIIVRIAVLTKSVFVTNH
jgi:hypothetical protein